MEKRHWTEEEDAIIKDNPGMPTKELLPMLPGRTEMSIKNRRKNYILGGRARRSKPFSPEPIVLKTKREDVPVEKPKIEYKPSYVETESIQAKAEAAKQAKGTYNDHPGETAVVVKPEQPVLADELTRLRCEVSRLQGMIDGVKLVLDRIGR